MREFDAAGLIERRHGKGIFISPCAKQRAIGLVFGQNIFKVGISPVYGMLLERCHQRTESRDEHFSFYIDLPTKQVDGQVYPMYRDLVESINALKLHGLLLMSRHSPEQERWLRSHKIPVVAFAAEMREPGIVGVDYGQAVRLAVKSLVAQGCKQIGLISSLGHTRSGNHTFNEEELRSFRDALCRHGLPCRQEWIWDRPVQPSMEKEDSRLDVATEGQRFRAMQDLLGTADGKLRSQSSDRIDGLVFTDDIMASEALR